MMRQKIFKICPCKGCRKEVHFDNPLTRCLLAIKYFFLISKCDFLHKKYELTLLLLSINYKTFKYLINTSVSIVNTKIVSEKYLLANTAKKGDCHENVAISFSISHVNEK